MLHTGDCVEVMASMPENSVDAIVCDPPYGLEFMGKEWDRLGAVTEAVTDTRNRDGNWTSKPFGGGGQRVRYGTNATTMQEWHQAWATEALRVAKPGAYLLAFGGTRTYHRLAVAVEDAGWIIRDCLVWAYAQGFPKSRALLKPAWEPIVMARKPGPLRELAIDACRIGSPPGGDPTRFRNMQGSLIYAQDEWTKQNMRGGDMDQTKGRWPANVVLTDPIFDGDVEGVVGGGAQESPGDYQRNGSRDWDFSSFGLPTPEMQRGYGDTGTYSRFFLIPKSARAEREPLITPEGHDKTKRFTSHPTVKPLDLMRHLVRLVTPSGGTVLDPFLGSGTTAIAAEMEGFAWIGIEREPEYVAIAEARLMGVQKGLGLDVPAPTPPARFAAADPRANYPKRRTVPQSSLYGGGLVGNDIPIEDDAA
jgi:DNA modification methylase